MAQFRKKYRRFLLVFAALCSVASGVAMLLYSFQSNLIYFYNPTDIVTLQESKQLIGKRLRAGGLVTEHHEEKTATSRVQNIMLSDGKHTLAVRYEGLLPPLFRINQGIVAEGVLTRTSQGNLQLEAKELLTKHDENYMPKEIQESLKKSGHWKQDAN